MFGWLDLLGKNFFWQFKAPQGRKIYLVNSDKKIYEGIILATEQFIWWLKAWQLIYWILLIWHDRVTSVSIMYLNFQYRLVAAPVYFLVDPY